MLAVVAIVLAANLPYLVGITDPNPLGPRSLLAATKPGPLRGTNTLDPTDGYITQALGRVAASDILHGTLPWWNPYEGVGMPLAAEGQSAALFPPTLLLALPNGQFYEDLLLELVAGVATLLVLRRIGVRRSAAVAGGVGFALNGAFAWLATSAFNPVAFLPLLVLGIEHAHAASVARRGGGWWLIAVSLALSLYAGFPETAYIDGLLAAAWFGWRCGCGDRQHLRRLAGKGAAGAGAGLLLAAPFLLPFLTALPHEYVGIHSGVAGALTMPHYSFPQLFLPYVYGPPFAFADRSGLLGAVWGYAGGFVPISLLFLGALSLLSAPRRGLKLILAAWVVLVISKVYGAPAWVGDVLLWLPGARSVAFYRYSFPAIAFALSVLAALGIDGIADQLRYKRRRVGATGIAVFTLAALAALQAHRLVVHLDGGPSHSRWAWAQIGWALAVLALGCASAIWLRGRRAWMLTAIVLADAVLMFSLHELSAPASVQIDRAPVAYLQRHLGTGRFFTLGPLAPNYGSYWGIASLNEIDVPLPLTWTSYVKRRLDPYVNPVFFVGNFGGARSPTVPSPSHELRANLNAYRAAGVRYVVSSPEQPLPEGPSTFQLVLRRPRAWIYRLSGSASYFSTRAPCAIRTGGRQVARVACSQPTTLVRRELGFPGWSAQVDGRATTIQSTDAIYQSVRVPAGRHTVTFSYAPPGLGWALAGLIAGAGWLTLAAGLACRRRLRGEPRS